MVFVLAFPIGRTLEVFWKNEIATTLVQLGSWWFAAMLYLTLGFILAQIGLLFLKIFGTEILPQWKLYSAVVVYSITLLLIIVGYINASNPIINRIEIHSEKNLSSGKLTIAMVSDIHLGSIIEKKELTRMVKMINSQHPDLVVMVGDIFDEDITPVKNGQMGDILRGIESKHGVYAVTGNHEFFGNYEAKIHYLNEYSIKILNDSATEVAGINLIGRIDRQSTFVLNKNRKSLTEIIQHIDREKPTILLDHQPFNLHETIEHKIDIQLSGHTHHGQLWPLNWITSSIYQVSQGYKKIGETHFYVSPGYGTWGPRVRLGNRPEIAIITLISTAN
ncbi:MAG TPA: metallophosphoesterase [Salinivirgaceae bacterium]|nr:metallophosphoesterase [Salinivirgaceae bacterium]